MPISPLSMIEYYQVSSAQSELRQYGIIEDFHCRELVG